VKTARGRTPRSRALLLDLLAYAVSGPESNREQGISPGRLGEVTDREIQWVTDAGLAPLLYRAARPGLDHIPAVRRNALLSADLTAQVRYGNLVDTANEIIDACRTIQVPVTLLKGISISEQYYPWWRAAVDDTSVRVSRVNYAMIGVPIPPGIHRVRLAIRPTSVWIGVTVSVVSLLVWMGLVVSVWRRQRDREP